MHRLGGLGFIAQNANVVLLGPPGVGKTHIGIGLGLRAIQGGHKVLFGTATEWIERLKSAYRENKLPEELNRFRKIKLLIIDELGYLPLDKDSANLFFQLISSRYEQACLILTSNLPFSRWGDVFGDQIVASAIIDRVVHHAEVINLKGASYRLSGHQNISLPSIKLMENDE